MVPMFLLSFIFKGFPVPSDTTVRHLGVVGTLVLLMLPDHKNSCTEMRVSTISLPLILFNKLKAGGYVVIENSLD